MSSSPDSTPSITREEVSSLKLRLAGSTDQQLVSVIPKLLPRLLKSLVPNLAPDITAALLDCVVHIYQRVKDEKSVIPIPFKILLQDVRDAHESAVRHYRLFLGVGFDKLTPEEINDIFPTLLCVEKWGYLMHEQIIQFVLRSLSFIDFSSDPDSRKAKFSEFMKDHMSVETIMSIFFDCMLFSKPFLSPQRALYLKRTYGAAPGDTSVALTGRDQFGAGNIGGRSPLFAHPTGQSNAAGGLSPTTALMSHLQGVISNVAAPIEAPLSLDDILPLGLSVKSLCRILGLASPSSVNPAVVPDLSTKISLRTLWKKTVELDEKEWNERKRKILRLGFSGIVPETFGFLLAASGLASNNNSIVEMSQDFLKKGDQLDLENEKAVQWFTNAILNSHFLINPAANMPSPKLSAPFAIDSDAANANPELILNDGLPYSKLSPIRKILPTATHARLLQMLEHSSRAMQTLQLVLRIVFDSWFREGTSSPLQIQALHILIRALQKNEYHKLQPFAKFFLNGLLKLYNKNKELDSTESSHSAFQDNTAPTSPASHNPLAPALGYVDNRLDYLRMVRKSEEQSMVRQLVYRSITVLASTAPAVFIESLDVPKILFSAIPLEPEHNRVALSEALSALAEVYTLKRPLGVPPALSPSHATTKDMDEKTSDHTLSVRALAYSMLPATSESILESIHHMLHEYKGHEDENVRYLVVRWATAVFPFHDIRARYLCACMAGDSVSRVKDLAIKGMAPFQRGFFRDYKYSRSNRAGLVARPMLSMHSGSQRIEGAAHAQGFSSLLRTELEKSGDRSGVADNLDGYISSDDDLAASVMEQDQNTSEFDEISDETLLQNRASFAQLAVVYPLFPSLLRFLTTSDSENQSSFSTAKWFVKQYASSDQETDNTVSAALWEGGFQNELDVSASGSTVVRDAWVNRESSAAKKGAYISVEKLSSLSSVSLALLVDLLHTSLDAMAVQMEISTGTYLSMFDIESSTDSGSMEVDQDDEEPPSILIAYRGLLEYCLSVPPTQINATLVHQVALRSLAELVTVAPLTMSNQFAARIPWIYRWIGDNNALVRSTGAQLLGSIVISLPLFSTYYPTAYYSFPYLGSFNNRTTDSNTELSSPLTAVAEVPATSSASLDTTIESSEFLLWVKHYIQHHLGSVVPKDLLSLVSSTDATSDSNRVLISSQLWKVFQFLNTLIATATNTGAQKSSTDLMIGSILALGNVMACLSRRTEWFHYTTEQLCLPWLSAYAADAVSSTESAPKWRKDLLCHVLYDRFIFYTVFHEVVIPYCVSHIFAAFSSSSSEVVKLACLECLGKIAALHPNCLPQGDLSTVRSSIASVFEKAFSDVPEASPPTNIPIFSSTETSLNDASNSLIASSTGQGSERSAFHATLTLADLLQYCIQVTINRTSNVPIVFTKYGAGTAQEGRKRGPHGFMLEKGNVRVIEAIVRLYGAFVCGYLRLSKKPKSVIQTKRQFVPSIGSTAGNISVLGSFPCREFLDSMLMLIYSNYEGLQFTIGESLSRCAGGSGVDRIYTPSTLSLLFLERAVGMAIDFDHVDEHLTDRFSAIPETPQKFLHALQDIEIQGVMVLQSTYVPPPSHFDNSDSIIQQLNPDVQPRGITPTRIMETAKGLLESQRKHSMFSANLVQAASASITVTPQTQPTGDSESQPPTAAVTEEPVEILESSTEAPSENILEMSARGLVFGYVMSYLFSKEGPMLSFSSSDRASASIWILSMMQVLAQDMSLYKDLYKKLAKVDRAWVRYHQQERSTSSAEVVSPIDTATLDKDKQRSKEPSSTRTSESPLRPLMKALSISPLGLVELYLPSLQACFFHLLRERNSLTVESAAKSLSLVHELSDEEMRESLSKLLVEMFTGRSGDVSPMAQLVLQIQNVTRKTFPHESKFHGAGGVVESSSDTIGPTAEIQQTSSEDVMSPVSASAGEEQEGTLVTSSTATEPSASTSGMPSTSILKPLAPGGVDATYREFCHITERIGRPDLIYHLVSLSRGQSKYRIQSSASVALDVLFQGNARKALLPHLPSILPPLYRYQYDPSEKVRERMESLWQTLVADSKTMVNDNFSAIVRDAVSYFQSSNWRERFSACACLADIIVGRTYEEMQPFMLPLWDGVLHLIDDINESVRKVALETLKSLKQVTLRLCDPAYCYSEREGQEMVNVVLPFLLEKGVVHFVRDAQKISIELLKELTNVCGKFLKPFLAQIVQVFLQATGSEEDSTLSQLQMHFQSDSNVLGVKMDAHEFEKLRIAAAQRGPYAAALQNCLNLIGTFNTSELLGVDVSTAKEPTTAVGSEAILADQLRTMDATRTETTQTSARTGDSVYNYSLNSYERGTLLPLCNILRDLLRTGIGLTTRGVTLRFLSALVIATGRDISPFIPVLIPALFQLITGREAAIREEGSKVLGQLSSHASPRVFRTILRKYLQLAVDPEVESQRISQKGLIQIAKHASTSFMENLGLVLPTLFVLSNTGARDANASISDTKGEQYVRDFIGEYGPDDQGLNKGKKTEITDEDIFTYLPGSLVYSIQLYLGEIVDKVVESLQSQFWDIRQKGCIAVIKLLELLAERTIRGTYSLPLSSLPYAASKSALPTTAKAEIYLYQKPFQTPIALTSHQDACLLQEATVPFGLSPLEQSLEIQTSSSDEALPRSHTMKTAFEAFSDIASSFFPAPQVPGPQSLTPYVNKLVRALCKLISGQIWKGKEIATVALTRMLMAYPSALCAGIERGLSVLESRLQKVEAEAQEVDSTMDVDMDEANTALRPSRAATVDEADMEGESAANSSAAGELLVSPTALNLPTGQSSMKPSAEDSSPTAQQSDLPSIYEVLHTFAHQAVRKQAYPDYVRALWTCLSQLLRVYPSARPLFWDRVLLRTILPAFSMDAHSTMESRNALTHGPLSAKDGTAYTDLLRYLFPTDTGNIGLRDIVSGAPKPAPGDAFTSGTRWVGHKDMEDQEGKKRLQQRQEEHERMQLRLALSILLAASMPDPLYPYHAFIESFAPISKGCISGATITNDSVECIEQFSLPIEKFTQMQSASLLQVIGSGEGSNNSTYGLLLSLTRDIQLNYCFPLLRYLTNVFISSDIALERKGVAKGMSFIASVLVSVPSTEDALDRPNSSGERSGSNSYASQKFVPYGDIIRVCAYLLNSIALQPSEVVAKNLALRFVRSVIQRIRVLTSDTLAIPASIPLLDALRSFPTDTGSTRESQSSRSAVSVINVPVGRSGVSPIILSQESNVLVSHCLSLLS